MRPGRLVGSSQGARVVENREGHARGVAALRACGWNGGGCTQQEAAAARLGGHMHACPPCSLPTKGRPPASVSLTDLGARCFPPLPPGTS